MPAFTFQRQYISPYLLAVPSAYGVVGVAKPGHVLPVKLWGVKGGEGTRLRPPSYWGLALWGTSNTSSGTSSRYADATPIIQHTSGLTTGWTDLRDGCEINVKTVYEFEKDSACAT